MYGSHSSTSFPLQRFQRASYYYQTLEMPLAWSCWEANRAFYISQAFEVRKVSEDITATVLQYGMVVPNAVCGQTEGELIFVILGKSENLSEPPDLQLEKELELGPTSEHVVRDYK